MKKIVFSLLIFLVLSNVTLAQEYSLMKINDLKQTKDDRDTTKIDSAYFNASANSTLTSFINGRLLAPTVNVVGSNYSQQGGFLGTVSLFKSAISDKIEDSAQLRTHLFNADASIFGFSGNFILMTRDKKCNEDCNIYADSLKHLLFRGQFNFIQKRLYLNSGEKFEPYFFHFKAGLEYMPVSNWISFYANLSVATPITQIESFRQITGYNSTSYLFLDYGVRCDLKLTDNSKVNIDLNFIGVTSTVRQISGTKDLVIPSIRIGVSQNLFGKKTK